MNDLADAGPCEDSPAMAWPSPTSARPTAPPPPPPSITYSRDASDSLSRPLLPRRPRPGVVHDVPSGTSDRTLPDASAERDVAAGATDERHTPGGVHEPHAAPAPAAAAVATPSIIKGPAAVLALDDAIAPLDSSALTLPDAAATPSRPSMPTSSAPGAEAFTRSVTRTTRSKRRLGRAVSTIAVLAGLGYAGVTYGPGLYEDYVADSGTDEPAAPMSFPRVRAGSSDVRTATFVLDGFATGSDAVYTVTVDFETRLSRVVIDREAAPDLEVLTFSDDALVRRLDSDEWFQIDRGSFPFDEQLQRTDWVRVVDDLLPVDQRAGVVIDESTEAEIGGVPTRHLTVTLDPTRLRPTQPDVLDPMADIAAAAGSDASPAAAVAATPASDPAPVDLVAAPRVANGEPVQVELWIDGEGVVRKSAGVEALGAQSITILRTTPEPWVPDYPSEGQVAPITAASLIELGL